MFVSDRIAFIELHKTGCTHIRQLLRELVGGEFVGKHNQAGPELFGGDRLLLGSIRNPWDWYISLWAYGCDGKGFIYRSTTPDRLRLRDHGWRQHPLLAMRKLLSQRPSPRAAEWQRTYRDVRDAGAFRQWLRMIHDPAYQEDIGEGYADAPVSRVAGLMSYRYLLLFTCRSEREPLEGIGSYAQLVEHERSRCFIDRFIRNEHLEADLFGALEHSGLAVPESKQAEILSRPRTNRSSRQHGADHYYDADTAALVADSEKLIVDKFGYPAPRAKPVVATAAAFRAPPAPSPAGG